MKYVDEFRNIKTVNKLAGKIKAIMPEGKVNVMEVCGTHTHNYYRFGIDKLIPKNLKLISGPGCPVCVSSPEYIDAAIYLAKDKNVIITTFGDMLRVPGTDSSLEKEKAKGSKIITVYSPLDAVRIAKENSAKKIIFLGVGFETTAPAIALTILAAKKERLKNLFFLTALKLIPPAMDFLLKDKRININGFLCPGHVSSIIGTIAYEFIPRKFGIGCCIAGFEPVDILEGLYLLLGQIIRKEPCVENQYFRAVNRQGNLSAQKIMREVFSIVGADWRGLGKIQGTGLKINSKFSEFDAEKQFGISYKASAKKSEAKFPRRGKGCNLKCRCGDVLKGLVEPDKCQLFRRICTPLNALGACMVSQEGACNAYYKYHKK